MIDRETGRIYSGRELNNGAEGLAIKLGVAFAVCIGLSVMDRCSAREATSSPAPVYTVR